ncbi:MAG TPA: bifunctional phosphopantothenoylcysteine decarboxylase/phosphopantothenate--cysteine ligase CoaBC [Acidobacteriaceae bacterium]|nr:bifunctional phosphopantothenoylcysteine decarboxylase/phosphopantothenate--cysteine ligase CoaBC [Acidobacteriaceae bacterium]
MKVTVGVSGGIAAYKAAELVRALQQQALDVHVVMTAAAQQFVTPLTFASLTGHRVITGLWNADGETPNANSAIEHIAEAQDAKALIIAPATADILARLACGLADDFLTTMALATPSPLLLAPAMNVQMWSHPATQTNLTTLRERGVCIIAPESGYLACGMIGDGRLAPIESIVTETMQALHRRDDYSEETVLVTAGGTREPLDPVRYLGNRSSGKMGYALAQAAKTRGARVVLISAPTHLQPPHGCEFVPVITAEEMRRAVLERLPGATLVIKAAAVSDFRPKTCAEQKMKRDAPLTLELEPTDDILGEVVRQRGPGTLVVGFAAETERPLEHARGKLHRKGADAIVLNDVARPEIGFDSDRNAVTFLTETTAIDLPEMPKRALADRILDETLALRRTRQVVAELENASDHMLR